MRFLIFLLSLLVVTPVQAKTLTIIVQSQNTQPYYVSKSLGKHIKKYLPDIDSDVVKVVPGGEALNAANYLYNVAEKDGYTIGTVGKNIAVRGLLREKNVQYDVQKFIWLGTISDGRTNPSVLYSNKPLSEELIIGEVSSSDSSLVELINSITNWKFKRISGYKDVPEMRLAFMRKEIDGFISNFYNVTGNDEYWNSQIVLQYGNGTVRLSELQNIPTLMEKIRDERSLKTLSVFELTEVIKTPYALPPNSPKDRVDLLRGAFTELLNDVEFLEEAGKYINIDPINWKETETIINQIMSIDPSLLKR